MFELLLEKTQNLVLSRLKAQANLSKIDGSAFESLVCETMKEAAIGTIFEGKLVQTPDREFPDIVDNEYFGVEVKVTKKNDWKSIGNSVLESSRVINIEKIYVLFGKLGGDVGVRVRSYEECLSGIAVTHYPRYKIDMDLAEGKTIFDLMGISYDSLRNDTNPVKPIRAYYSSTLKEGQELWWVSDDLDESTASTPVIQTFSSLSSDKKTRLKAEAFILFPEIFSNSTTKFENVAAYWITKHNIVCPNVRDIFTAGGQVTLLDSAGNEYRAPQIVGELIRLAPIVEKLLNEKTLTDLTYDDDVHVEDRGVTRSEWIYQLNKRSSGLDLPESLSTIYERNRITEIDNRKEKIYE